jgi:hypothetical protein
MHLNPTHTTSTNTRQKTTISTSISAPAPNSYLTLPAALNTPHHPPASVYLPAPTATGPTRDKVAVSAAKNTSLYFSSLTGYAAKVLRSGKRKAKIFLASRREATARKNGGKVWCGGNRESVCGGVSAASGEVEERHVKAASTAGVSKWRNESRESQ